MIAVVCTLFEIPSVALAIIPLASSPPHRVAPLSLAPPVHPYLTAVPSTSRITPSALSTRPPTDRKMSDDAKLQNKYHLAKGRVARWEAWATELRQGRDADVYLENREDVIREMVSGWRAMYHIPLIQRRPQLQAHSGARAIPNRGNTMIDFVAATYHAQGDNPEFSS